MAATAGARWVHGRMQSVSDTELETPAVVAVDLQYPGKPRKVITRVRALTVFAVDIDDRRRLRPQARRLVPASTHSRPALVRPQPGFSTGTGVSSAKIFGEAHCVEQPFG